MLESERRRSKLIKANPLGHSAKNIALKIPTPNKKAVLAPSMVQSKITR